MTRFTWSLTRFVRASIRLLFLYPVMLLLFVPDRVFCALCRFNSALDNWWAFEKEVF